MGKFTVKNKNILIVGLGKTGSVSAKALRDMGANISLWDDNKEAIDKARKDGYDCPTSIEDIDFKSLELILWSPGIPHTFPIEKAHPIAKKAKQEGVRLMSDINLFYLLNPDATYVGITGSNGKSTTTKLTYFTLQQMEKNVYLGGNIGSTIMFENPSIGKGDICVVELSSYQLELSPDLRLAVGALLNITPDHLARHGGFEGYVDAKKIICNISDKLVIAIDDENTKKVADVCAADGRDLTTVSAFGSEAQLYVEERDVKGNKTSVIVNNLSGTPRKVLDLGEIEYLKGLHNAQNIEVVYAIMKSLGFCGKRTMKAVKEFTGLEHRQQIVGTKNIDGLDVLFVNDSKATNAEAVEPALRTYSSYDIYWIAGGQTEDCSISSLEKDFFSKGIVYKSFLIGNTSKSYHKICSKYHSSFICNKMDIAIKKIIEEIKNDIKINKLPSNKNICVLMSPANKSWDQYPSFEVRGNAFIDLFNKI